MKERSKARRSSLLIAIRWFGIFLRAVLGTPARAVRGTARLVADPARQVVDYWISERVTMRHAFTAISIAAMTALIAGLTLAGMDHRIHEVQGLFVLIPVSIGMRGNIFGALAARFGTSIHSGLFEVSWEREGVLYQNVYGAALLTLVTSVMMALIARGVAGLIGLETVSALDFVVVALVGGVLSSAVVLAVTIYVSILSWRRGWDLDSVGAPLITAMGDVVTLPCLLLASYLVHIDHVTPVLGTVAILAAVAALVRGVTDPGLVARRIVRESFPVLAVAIVLDVLAGAVVQPRVGEVFLAYPALLIVIPGFLENTGALGSVLAARLGSKLHLGAISAKARPDPVALLDGTIVLVLGITVYALTAVSTLALAEIVGANYPGALRFIGITMVGGLLATVVASVIGYYAAAATFRFGFDPDNHTIPIVTSGMDLLGAICLVVALSIFGVA